MYTNAAFSLCFIIATRPTINDINPDRAAITAEIDKRGLLKKVSPPFWPVIIKIINIIIQRINEPIKPTDHFPNLVFIIWLHDLFYANLSK